MDAVDVAEIFVACAPSDAKLARELGAFLQIATEAPCRYQDDVMAGLPKKDWIAVMDRAKVIVLLLSVHLFNSAEGKAQVERAEQLWQQHRTLLFWVRLRPLDWSPPNVERQWLILADKAVVLWDVRDAAWQKIAATILANLPPRPLRMGDVEPHLPGRYKLLFPEGGDLLITLGALPQRSFSGFAADDPLDESRGTWFLAEQSLSEQPQLTLALEFHAPHRTISFEIRAMAAKMLPKPQPPPRPRTLSFEIRAVAVGDLFTVDERGRLCTWRRLDRRRG